MEKSRGFEEGVSIIAHACGAVSNVISQLNHFGTIFVNFVQLKSYTHLQVLDVVQPHHDVFIDFRLLTYEVRHGFMQIYQELINEIIIKLRHVITHS